MKPQVLKKFIFALGLLGALFLSPLISKAQDTSGHGQGDFKPSGRLWGYAFGDFFYKSHADSSNRGVNNQYTGYPANRNAFQMRRVYLGYDYDITKKFSAELLLAFEDNSTIGTTTTGDLTTDNKASFYIKLINLRWKNIWKGTDLVVGEVATPAFPLLSEKIWGYRSVERTVSDIRRTPSFDLGATLQGTFDPETQNYGYNLMVGNGNGAKPEASSFKWFYGDVWAKFLDKHLIFDLYADYQRITWNPTWHHSRNMIKGYAAYTTDKLTVGVEAFVNHGLNDVAGIVPKASRSSDTVKLSSAAFAISSYVRGKIYQDKLSFFARYDNYNPDGNYNKKYVKYIGYSNTYEPNTKEQFITAGIDYTPIKNAHFIPNIWYDRYSSQQANLHGLAKTDHDTVWRMTFFYTFGK